MTPASTLRRWWWHSLSAIVLLKMMYGEALKLMSPYKASGPNGFPNSFYQHHWPLIKEEVTTVVMTKLNQGTIHDEFADALLVPISKVDNLERCSQLRPISLLNIVFKIVEKMLVFRLKPMLSKLISPSQSSFIPGRQVLDNFIIFQEVINSMNTRRSTSKWMVLKSDLEKAYGRIRWSFLRQVLTTARISTRLVDTIRCCQTIGKTRLLWN